MKSNNQNSERKFKGANLSLLSRSCRSVTPKVVSRNARSFRLQKTTNSLHSLLELNMNEKQLQNNDSPSNTTLSQSPMGSHSHSKNLFDGSSENLFNSFNVIDNHQDISKDNLHTSPDFNRLHSDLTRSRSEHKPKLSRPNVDKTKIINTHDMINNQNTNETNLMRTPKIITDHLKIKISPNIPTISVPNLNELEAQMSDRETVVCRSKNLNSNAPQSVFKNN